MEEDKDSKASKKYVLGGGKHKVRDQSIAVGYTHCIYLSHLQLWIIIHYDSDHSDKWEEAVVEQKDEDQKFPSGLTHEWNQRM